MRPFTKPVDGDELVGANVLGRLLMELRENLHAGEIRKLRRVDPLDVPDLLLFGQPIGVVEASEESEAKAPVMVADGGRDHQNFAPQPSGSSPQSDAGEVRPAALFRSTNRTVP